MNNPIGIIHCNFVGFLGAADRAVDVGVGVVGGAGRDASAIRSATRVPTTVAIKSIPVRHCRKASRHDTSRSGA